MGPFSQPFDYAMVEASGQIEAGSARPLAGRPSGGLTRVMRVTKFEHATVTLNQTGKTLVIDPGTYTTPLVDLGEVVGVVITHEHPDHWTPDHLDRLRKGFPGVPIFGPEGGGVGPWIDDQRLAGLLQSQGGVLELRDSHGSSQPVRRGCGKGPRGSRLDLAGCRDHGIIERLRKRPHRIAA